MSSDDTHRTTCSGCAGRAGRKNCFPMSLVPSIFFYVFLLKFFLSGCTYNRSIREKSPGFLARGGEKEAFWNTPEHSVLSEAWPQETPFCQSLNYCFFSLPNPEKGKYPAPAQCSLLHWGKEISSCHPLYLSCPTWVGEGATLRSTCESSQSRGSLKDWDLFIVHRIIECFPSSHLLPPHD